MDIDGIRYSNYAGFLVKKMRLRNYLMVSFLCISLVLSGCATTSQYNQKPSSATGKKEKVGTIVGLAGGAAAGAIVGKKVGGKKGEIIGALVGAAIGAYLGRQIGKAFDDRDRRLAEIKKREGVDMDQDSYAFFENDKQVSSFETKLSNMSEAQRKKSCQEKTVYKTTVFSPFKTGSVNLSAKMHRVFLEIARTYKADGIRKVLIIGHTDSQGPADVNQRLSEERAKAVARVFMEAGYPPSDIYYQGAGETEPIADNSTPEGRAKNRRIEISDASKVWDLAKAKRYFVVEDREAMNRVKQRPMVQHFPQRGRMALNFPHCSSVIPFNGSPYHGQRLVAFGYKAPNEVKQSLWEKFKQALAAPGAQAATAQAIPDFLKDEIKVSGRVKRLDGKQEDIFGPDDYLPPYRKWPIYYMVGEAFLDLKPVSILKERALVDCYPKMGIWLHQDTKRPPNIRLKGVACLYITGDKMLYRWKADRRSIRQGGILGIDVLLPIFQEKSFQHEHDEYLDSMIYYLKNGRVFVTRTKWIIHLPQKPHIKWRVM